MRAWTRLVTTALVLAAAVPSTARAGNCVFCQTTADCKAISPDGLCVRWSGPHTCGNDAQICCPGQGCAIGVDGRPSCEAPGNCVVVGDDGGTPSADLSARGDGGRSGSSGGCSCSTGASPRTDIAAPALLVLFALFRRRRLMGFLALMSGCAQDSPIVDQPDLGMPDIAVAPSCRWIPPAPIVGAQPLDPNRPTRQFVVSWIQLPINPSEFAIDLDGDGMLDNKFSSFFNLLRAYNIDPQVELNRSIADGDMVLLLDLPEPIAQVRPLTIYPGLMRLNPDGTTSFRVDLSRPPIEFPGVIVNGAFSEFSFSAQVGSRLPILPLVPWQLPDGKIWKFPLRCQRMQLQLEPDGSLIKGQLNGSILSDDVNPTIIQSIADYLNGILSSSDNSMHGQTIKSAIKSFFDVGGGRSNNYMPCTNLDGSLGIEGDGHISYCEVELFPDLVNRLSPDLDTHDDTCRFAPRSKPNTPDSISFGLLFYARPAKFY